MGLVIVCGIYGFWAFIRMSMQLLSPHLEKTTKFFALLFQVEILEFFYLLFHGVGGWSVSFCSLRGTCTFTWVLSLFPRLLDLIQYQNLWPSHIYIYVYNEPMTIWPTDNNAEAFLVGISTFSLQRLMTTHFYSLIQMHLHRVGQAQPFFLACFLTHSIVKIKLRNLKID